jgi:hypothetical protein
MSGDYDAKSVCIVAKLFNVVAITKVKREKQFDNPAKQFDRDAEYYDDDAE